MLATKWEEYYTRLMRFRLAEVKFGFGNSGDMSANEIERIRTRALMDMIRVEFPNSINNLKQFPSLHSQNDAMDLPDAFDPSNVNDTDGERVGMVTDMDVTEPSYWPDAWRDNYITLVTNPQRQPSALARLRFKLRMQLQSVKSNGVEIWDIPDTRWDPQFEDAECLYVLLQTIRIDDATGLEYCKLRPNEIGDTDGDGWLEVLDGFGDPLFFRFNDPESAPDLDTLEPSLPAQTPFVVGSFNNQGT